MVCGVCSDEEEVKKVDGVAVVLKDYEERRTTDSLYLLILIATWVAMTILGIIASKDGDINRLIAPYNNQNPPLFCGHSDGVEDKPFLQYIKLSYGYGICVEECPKVSASLTSQVIADYQCAPEVTDAAATPGDFAAYLDLNCNDPTAAAASTYSYSSETYCFCALNQVSAPYFQRCVQTGLTPNSENPNAKDIMKMFMADVITARAVIFGFGFGMALVFAFLYTYLMSINCLAWMIVWGCVSGVLVLGVAIVWFGQEKLKEWKAEDPLVHTVSQQQGLEIFNYGFMAFCIIWFLLMIWFCSAINMAIKCVCMGAKALEEMPLMIFIPIFQITGFILFMIPWVYFCMFIASDGKFQNVEVDVLSTPPMEINYQSWEVDHENKTGMKIGFMFFVLLWTMNFIANIGSIVIAHAVATWYFTKPAERAEAISNSQLWASYKLVFRFHLGTVAFGSLLIAIIQYMRAVALYIQKHTSKEFRDKQWVKIVFCCINCCLWCLETCLKFISKNAYIQTAIAGTPFCRSAANVFSLIANNMMRIGAILVTSQGALFIGKIFVTVLATGTSYIFINDYFTADLYEPVGPTILIAIISWMTATMFMDVLDMAISTIFQCFIADETSNGGVPAFAGDELKGFVDTHGAMEAPADGEAVELASNAK